MTPDRYRVRPGWRGVSVLQRLVNGPAFFSGHVDASIRVLSWLDVRYEHAPESLRIEKPHPCLSCRYYRDERCNTDDVQFRDFSCRETA